MIGIIHQNRHTGILVLRHQITQLQKAFIPARVDADPIQSTLSIATPHFLPKSFLPSQAGFVEELPSELQKPSIGLILPAIHHIVLGRFRHIQKAIVVSIVFHGQPIPVSQDGCAPLVIQTDACIGIEFDHPFTIPIGIDKNLFARSRLFIIDTDLSGNRFIAIDYRTGPLRNRDSAHPRAWDIIQSV